MLFRSLRVMEWEEDAQKTADFQKMAAVAGSGMTLRLYVDSVNFHASEESPDDVLQGPVAVLPSVLVSPIKNYCQEKERATKVFFAKQTGRTRISRDH